MGIHHSDFGKVFSCLEKEIPISLSEAIDKWKGIKNDSQRDIRKWMDLLEENSIQLMDNNYSVGTAMIKAWGSFYELMIEDGERGYFNISDLRDSFFNKSLDKLEDYEDGLIDKANRVTCKYCGWFTWDYQRNKGYCNNFCIERRSLKSRCVSEEE